MANFEVGRSDNGEVSVLSISGYLDAHTAKDFEKAFQELIKQERYKIVVSMEALDYISSAGMGVFMGFIEQVRENSGDIKLSSVSKNVYKVFDLLGFPSLYEFYDESEEAQKKFN